MPAVESSAIRAVDYNRPTRRMTVVFRSGTQYDYTDVPEAEYVALLNAESIGRYFSANIRPRYKYRKTR